MSFPYTYKLKPPIYCYSEDGSATHRDKLRGLLSFAPIRPARVTQPRCLFVFIENDRDHANHLYLSLRNGIANFPGCRQLTGISLERGNVQAVLVPQHDENHATRHFAESIENHLASATDKPDFAFIVYSKRPSLPQSDPYSASKAVLTKHQIPSQYVSWELLDSSNQFRYAISNIALSFFVKLGGIPWTVKLERQSPTLVIGIGRAEIQDEVQRAKRKLIGYSVCTLSDGTYLETRFYPPAENQEQFETNLGSGLYEALSRLSQQVESVDKVTVHVSQQTRRQVVHIIRDTIATFEREQSTPTPFEVIRLTDDSDFSVFDTSSPGYVSEEGTVVVLGNNHALLVTEGRREASVWRGRKPVTLELNREHSSSSRLDLGDSLRDAFRLSSVNWRGFNAVTQPISLQYAKLLTHQVAQMSEFDPQICNYLQNQDFEQFNRTPWFI